MKFSCFFFVTLLLFDNATLQKGDSRIYVSYDAPRNPYEKEEFGLRATVEIFDLKTKEYIPFKFLIDTLSCATWVVSENCNSDECGRHNKLTQMIHLGKTEMKMNNGHIYGHMYLIDINLQNYILGLQPIILVDEITIKDFKYASFDGIIGLAKFQHTLTLKESYLSVLQNIIKQKKPPFIVLKLGGLHPYIKFGEISYQDEYYFKDLSDKDVKRIPKKENKQLKEQPLWINLYEEGMFVLPLRHIKLLYKDKNGNIQKSLYAVSNCIEYGCRSTLDTKSYFIYGPESQMSKLLSLKRHNCYGDDLNSLPDIEFAFYDINVNRNRKISSRVLTLTLEPKDYMISINEGGIDDEREMNCVPGFGTTGTQFGWNFGIMFMKKFLIAYDFEEERIGFVRISEDL